jgi:hypothetical protein
MPWIKTMPRTKPRASSKRFIRGSASSLRERCPGEAGKVMILAGAYLI